MLIQHGWSLKMWSRHVKVPTTTQLLLHVSWTGNASLSTLTQNETLYVHGMRRNVPPGCLQGRPCGFQDLALHTCSTAMGGLGGWGTCRPEHVCTCVCLYGISSLYSISLEVAFHVARAPPISSSADHTKGGMKVPDMELINFLRVRGDGRGSWWHVQIYRNSEQTSRKGQNLWI